MERTYIQRHTTILIIGKGNKCTAAQVEENGLGLRWKVDALDLTKLLEKSTRGILSDFTTITTRKVVITLKTSLDIGRSCKMVKVQTYDWH